MRPTHLDVDLDALIRNFRTAQSLADGRPVLCVVKGNGYGHGLVAVSRALSAAGASRLGVATVDEGLTLRREGIGQPILLLGGYLPEEAPDIVAADLTPALFHHGQIAPLARAARERGGPVPVHVKVDTGMGRLGFAPDEAVDVVRKVAAMPELDVEGMFTHFAEADLADSPAAEEQLARFRTVYRALGELARQVPFWHASNSAALMRRLGTEEGGIPPAGLFRPGIMLYGIPPSPGFEPPVPLEPVATWRASMIQVKTVPAGTPISYGRTFVTRRESRIATLPVGYADGYRRHLSNGGKVLVRGRRFPVVGRVCMDMTMVDVTDLPGEVGVGEEAVLLGRQGDDEITATELGTACGTIAYDILCGISERVPRRHLGRDRNET